MKGFGQVLRVTTRSRAGGRHLNLDLILQLSVYAPVPRRNNFAAATAMHRPAIGRSVDDIVTIMHDSTRAHVDDSLSLCLSLDRVDIPT